MTSTEVTAGEGSKFGGEGGKKDGAVSSPQKNGGRTGTGAGTEGNATLPAVGVAGIVIPFFHCFAFLVRAANGSIRL